MTEQAETLWRCTECGKWSHAQRRPRRHERFQADEPEDESKIIMQQEIGLHGDFGYVVACGPFEEWRAVQVTAARADDHEHEFEEDRCATCGIAWYNAEEH